MNAGERTHTAESSEPADPGLMNTLSMPSHKSEQSNLSDRSILKPIKRIIDKVLIGKKKHGFAHRISHSHRPAVLLSASCRHVFVAQCREYRNRRGFGNGTLLIYFFETSL
jgi:hypothetical protein